MKFYKVTDLDGYTRRGESNETLWGDGVTHRAEGGGYELCSDGLIHMYESPEIAVFTNPIHGGYDEETMLLWECKAHGKIYRDGQLKCGAKSVTTIGQIEKPIITMTQRVEIAIRCALVVYNDAAFASWAENWLSGEDRSARSAESARLAAQSAWSVWSAWSAAWSARLAAQSAWSAWSAWSAAESARSAARSAAQSAESDNLTVDLQDIINQVIG